MSLPTASDNPFPSLLIDEASAPSSPAAGKRRLYADTNHVLRWKDSAGLDSPLAALNKWNATAAPAVTDDSGDGYAVGSRWIDTTNDKEYVCLDSTVGAAVWTETTSTGGSGGGGELGHTIVSAPNFTTSSLTSVQITSMSVTVTIPAGGSAVKVTVFGETLANSNSGSYSLLTIWEGTVGSGTLRATSTLLAALNNQTVPAVVMAVFVPTSGSKTYNAGLHASAGTAQFYSSGPTFILVELL